MKTKRVLAIIDMQSGFLNELDEKERDRVTTYVYLLLLERKYDLIINVSFCDDCLNTSTDPTLRKMLKLLPNVIDVSKGYDDGSEEIARVLYAKGIDKDKCKLELIGVNTDCCVQATATGLKKTQQVKNVFLHIGGVATTSPKNTEQRCLAGLCSEGIVTLIEQEQ